MQRMFWICATLLVISGTVSAVLWRELRNEHALSTSLQEKLSETAGRLRAANSSSSQGNILPTASIPVATQPATTPENTPTAPSVNCAKSVDAAAAQLKAINAELELWKDPEYRKARLAQLRSNIAQTYPGLAEELGLSKEESDRLFDMIAESQLNTSTLTSRLAAAGSQPDRAALDELNRAQQASQRELNESLMSMLGAGRYAQWQAYQPSRTARVQATSYGAMLAQAGQPLSSSQLKSMTTTLVTEQQAQRQDAQALSRSVNSADPQARAQMEESSRKRQEEYNRRILDGYAQYLNPQQLGILRAQFEQQDALSRAAARARERAAQAAH